LECFYTFKEISASIYYLGIDINQTVDSNGKTHLCQVGPPSCVKEALAKISDLLGKKEMMISLGNLKYFLLPGSLSLIPLGFECR